MKKKELVTAGWKIIRDNYPKRTGKCEGRFSSRFSFYYFHPFLSNVLHVFTVDRLSLSLFPSLFPTLLLSSVGNRLKRGRFETLARSTKKIIALNGPRIFPGIDLHTNDPRVWSNAIITSFSQRDFEDRYAGILVADSNAERGTYVTCNRVA